MDGRIQEGKPFILIQSSFCLSQLIVSIQSVALLVFLEDYVYNRLDTLVLVCTFAIGTLVLAPLFHTSVSNTTLLVPTPWFTGWGRRAVFKISYCHIINECA